MGMKHIQGDVAISNALMVAEEIYCGEDDNVIISASGIAIKGKSVITEETLTETDPTVPAWAKAATKPTYTASEVGLGNVENKSSATIRSELTKANVTDALGYTPPEKDTVYTLPAAGTSLGGVKTGGNVTVSNGIITVNDDGHNHTIANVDGLQENLDAIEDNIDALVGCYSEGLTFSEILGSDNSEIIAYSVDGVGTCTTTKIVIPNFYRGKPVTAIDNAAFQNCSSLTNITIPDSVTSIGTQAFKNCTSLTSIRIPHGVTIIHTNTFTNCVALASLTIPSSIIWFSDESGIPSCTALTDIYYTGTSSEWQSDESLRYISQNSTATVHYNYTDNFMVLTKRLEALEARLAALEA